MFKPKSGEMNSAKNVNENNYFKPNIKSGYLDKMSDADPSTEACLQNNLNARQLNNGQTAWNRRWSSVTSLYSRTSKQRKAVLVVVMATVLLAGVVAVCASFVMLGAMGVQRMRISTLENELEALKAENELCRNETASLGLQLTACERDLQNTQHQLELNAAQCELDKGDLNSRLAAEVRKGEHEKEIAEERLKACEGSKEELSEKIESQTRTAEAEKRELGGKLDECEQKQSEMLRRRDEEIQQQVAERLNAASAAASDRDDASRWAPSRSQSNGAERVGSMKAALVLLAMLLPLLFKVGQVV